MERYTSQGASVAWRVNRWQLACSSLVLGDTEDRNDVSEKWLDEWPLDTWVDSPIFRWLSDTFLAMVVNKSAKYPKPDKDEASNEARLQRLESLISAVPCALPPQKAVLFCPLPGRVHNVK